MVILAPSGTEIGRVDLATRAQEKALNDVSSLSEEWYFTIL